MSRARLARSWWWLILGFPFVSLVLVVVGVLLAAQGGLAVFAVPGEDQAPIAQDAATLQRGEYLARIGNCVGCHTARGGKELAGGRAFPTDWGVLYSGNLTPDPDTGIGNWSPAQFRHAMTQGVARTGPLYPAFPFQHFQHLDPTDIDAIFAWLRSRPGVVSPRPANTLKGLASWRTALIGWRMLFHRPATLPQAAGRDAAWQRGQYLVEGLGHCAMCHGRRGLFGSQEPALRFAGGRIPQQGWVAPPLDREALARWSRTDLADYLQTGVGRHGSAFGPMAEVVRTSLQYLERDDALAMAAYLLDLQPVRWVPRLDRPPQRARDLVDQASAGLYRQHCADCHGRDGEGEAGAYPPLANNPQVAALDPVNLIRIILIGAAAPSTRGNPAPHSMPPFGQRLSDAELLAILNHVRGSFGNDAPAIDRQPLQRVRALPLE